METSTRARARKQLLFALALLAVAVAGYLVTRSYEPAAPAENASSTVVTTTPAEPAAEAPAATAPAREPVAPGRQALEGTYVCLPHRDTGGPQTLECALGLRADDGRHYALRNSGATAERAQAVTPTGVRVRVTGTVVPVEALSSDQWRKYDVVGVVEVATFAEVAP